MKLYQKISLGFLGSFILLGGLGTFFLHKNFKIQSRNKQAFEQARIETRTVTEVSRSLYLIQSYSQELIMLQELKSSEADRGYYRDKIEQELKNLDLNVVKGLNATLVETKQRMRDNSEDIDTQAEDLGTINGAAKKLTYDTSSTPVSSTKRAATSSTPVWTTPTKQRHASS